MKRIVTKVTFSYCLKKAWDTAKTEIARNIEAEKQNRINRANIAAMEAAAADNPRIAEIDKELFLLEMIDRQSLEDKDERDRLYAERKSILMGGTVA